MITAVQVLLIIAGILLLAFLICAFINRKTGKRKKDIDNEDEKHKRGFCFFFIELIFGLFGGS
ncbi:MAG: hypothetical protein ACRC3B_10005 [Bacteroidia bacterium]